MARLGVAARGAAGLSSARSARAGRWLPATAALVTVAVFVVVVIITGFLACGVSGCGGGGFGPAYAPTEAQAGLLVAGLTLVPLAWWASRRWRWALRALTTLGALALGSAVSMVVLGLGPDGCPQGQTRATAGPEAFDPGSSTCSGQRDAVPRR